jgi:CBS domain-containing protein
VTAADAMTSGLVVEGDRLVGILTHSDLPRALIPRSTEAVA